MEVNLDVRRWGLRHGQVEAAEQSTIREEWTTDGHRRIQLREFRDAGSRLPRRRTAGARYKLINLSDF